MAKKKNLDVVADNTNAVEMEEVKVDVDTLAESIENVDTTLPNNEDAIKEIETKINEELEPVKELAKKVNEATEQNTFNDAISVNPENAAAIIENEIKKIETLKGEVEKIMKVTDKKIGKQPNITNWWNGMGYDF